MYDLRSALQTMQLFLNTFKPLEFPPVENRLKESFQISFEMVKHPSKYTNNVELFKVIQKEAVNAMVQKLSQSIFEKELAIALKRIEEMKHLSS